MPGQVAGKGKLQPRGHSPGAAHRKPVRVGLEVRAQARAPVGVVVIIGLFCHVPVIFAFAGDVGVHIGHDGGVVRGQVDQRTFFRRAAQPEFPGQFVLGVQLERNDVVEVEIIHVDLTQQLQGRRRGPPPVQAEQGIVLKARHGLGGEVLVEGRHVEHFPTPPPDHGFKKAQFQVLPGPKIEAMQDQVLVRVLAVAVVVGGGDFQQQHPDGPGVPAVVEAEMPRPPGLGADHDAVVEEGAKGSPVQPGLEVQVRRTHRQGRSPVLQHADRAHPRPIRYKVRIRRIGSGNLFLFPRLPERAVDGQGIGSAGQRLEAEGAVHRRRAVGGSVAAFTEQGSGDAHVRGPGFGSQGGAVGLRLGPGGSIA